MSVNKERAWQELVDLSFDRVTGTEGEAKAAEYLKKACEDLGVKAEIEPYEIDTSDIHTAKLVTAGGKEYTVFGVAHSGSTPAEGITAPLAYAGEGKLDTDFIDIKGKIVLVSGMVPGGLAKKLKEKGAVGFLTVHGGYYDDDIIAKGPRVRTLPAEANVDLPGLSIHMRDARDLVCEHLGEDVTLTLSQTPGKLTARNVVAVIPGTTVPEEEVVLSAHFDTVIYAKGSWDNGSGSVTLLEALHHFLENPPARTVRLLWCGSEEIGLVGSRKYCEAHKEELGKIIYDINIDMLGAPLSRTLFCASADESVLHYLEVYAKIKGFPVKSELGMYSSDSSSFAGAGVPAASFGQDMPRGGAEIHNYRDTLDEVDPQRLYKDISFVIDYAETIINAKVNPVPRTFAPQVKETMEKRMKMMAEMRGIDPNKKSEEKKDEEKKEEGK